MPIDFQLDKLHKNCYSMKCFVCSHTTASLSDKNANKQCIPVHAYRQNKRLLPFCALTGHFLCGWGENRIWEAGSAAQRKSSEETCAD